MQKKEITFTSKVQCADDEPDSIPRIPVSLWQQAGLRVGTVAPKEGHRVAQSWPWPHGKLLVFLLSWHNLVNGLCDLNR